MKIEPFSVNLGRRIVFEVHGDESIGVRLGREYVALSPQEMSIFLVELRAGYQTSAE